jgi:hypothetical protein
VDAYFEDTNDTTETDLYQEIELLVKADPWCPQAIGAVIGVAGCVIAPVFGAICDVTTWVISSIQINSYLHIVTIISCALTLPFLMLGGWCVDLLEKSSRANIQSCSPPNGDAESATVLQQSSIREFTRPAGTPFKSLILLLVLLPALKLNAQQTVFNVPTTDVLNRGKVYFELDGSAKPTDPKFSSFVPRLVVGVGSNVEVGLNITGNIQPGPDSTTLVPAVKWKAYDGKDNGWAVVLGDNLYVPVRNKSYDMGTYAYTMVQKNFSSSTRLGAGGYFFSRNVVAQDANRAGGQFTFEQQLTRKLNLNADWFTGKHSNGYLTTGLAYKLANKITVVGAYSVGNQNASNGNHFFYFEVGYNFN